jgi:hypothetical protein
MNGVLSCNGNNDMNARLQVLFVVCLVFPTVIHILDSDLRALAMISKK